MRRAVGANVLGRGAAEGGRENLFGRVELAIGFQLSRWSICRRGW